MEVDEEEDSGSKQESSEKTKKKQEIVIPRVPQTETPPLTSPIQSRTSHSVAASEESGTSDQTQPEEMQQVVKTVVSDQPQSQLQSKTVSEAGTQTEPLAESSQAQLSTEAVSGCNKGTTSSTY